MRLDAFFCYTSLNFCVNLHISKSILNKMIRPILAIFAPFNIEKCLISGRRAGFIMDPAVQMYPPYFTIKEAVNQIQNNMVSSQSQTERKTKTENENI